MSIQITKTSKVTGFSDRAKLYGFRSWTIDMYDGQLCKYIWETFLSSLLSITVPLPVQDESIPHNHQEEISAAFHGTEKW
ncbi:hypothetical protein STEG23_009757, partial [Scotinomys teguina]